MSEQDPFSSPNRQPTLRQRSWARKSGACSTTAACRPASFATIRRRDAGWSWRARACTASCSRRAPRSRRPSTSRTSSARRARACEGRLVRAAQAEGAAGHAWQRSARSSSPPSHPISNGSARGDRGSRLRRHLPCRRCGGSWSQTHACRAATHDRAPTRASPFTMNWAAPRPVYPSRFADTRW
jgi:hypothetical protein